MIEALGFSMKSEYDSCRIQCFICNSSKAADCNEIGPILEGIAGPNHLHAFYICDLCKNTISAFPLTKEEKQESINRVLGVFDEKADVFGNEHSLCYFMMGSESKTRRIALSEFKSFFLENY